MSQRNLSGDELRNAAHLQTLAALAAAERVAMQAQREEPERGVVARLRQALGRG